MRFIFLFCSERSGSNFITNLLGGHPKISGPPPSHLFRLICKNLNRYGDFQNSDCVKLLAEDLAEGQRKMLGLWETSITKDELISQVSGNAPADLLRFMYEKEGRAKNATNILVKENQTYSFLPFLLAHFPDSKFLFFVRDPRDVASSWLTTDSIPGGIKKAVDVWEKDQRNNLDYFHQLRANKRAILVRYEDVLRGTKAAVTAITDWLDLEYSEAVFTSNENKRTIENSRKINAWKNIGKPVLSDNYAKFKSILTDDEIKYIEVRTSDLMEQLGYDPVYEFRTDCSPADHIVLEDKIRAGSYNLAKSEKEIRDRRLEYIQNILARPIVSLFD